VLNKLGSQQRVILATLLSVIVFVIFDFFAPKPEIKPELNQTQSSHTTQPTPTASSSSVATAQTVPSLQTTPLATVTTPLSTISIDTKGRISQVVVDESKYAGAAGSKVSMFNHGDARPLEIRFSDPTLNDEAFKAPYSVDQKSVSVTDGSTAVVTLEQNLSSVTVQKKITFKADGSYTVAIKLSNDVRYYLSVGYRPDVKIDPMTFHGALITENDETITTIDDEDAKGEEVFAKAKVAAAVDQYYASILFETQKGMDVTAMADKDENPVLFIAGQKELTLGGYIGPKFVKTLNDINPLLDSVVEYGMFTFIAKPIYTFLDFFENSVGNWGWGIVILTIVIRILLFPLTYKGMMSMGKLKDLAPKLKDIQTKYKGDPQKLNIHMMELYKKHNVNPIGGCLPMLLQIPIFFAIYRVLLNAIELKGAAWILWIDDLSVMDPYFVLPILMGATMFIQQKITPTTFTDPLQQKIFLYLPLVFTVFFLWFPAGLTLYWFVNNIFSIGQQHMINKTLEAKRALKGHDD
jgi:YidC/Oxa1 family membrane protein insertase